MKRIICDICGTSYPENDERCPICSYPRQGNEKLDATPEATTYTKVKGGRFSSKNVKKRRKAQLRSESGKPAKDPDRPLVIVIIILLIAIMLVSAYIGVRFLRGRDSNPPAPDTTASATAGALVTTVPPTVPCSDIVLDEQVLDMEILGDQKQLSVMLKPADTTDTAVYVSADPTVAEVSQTGLITAMGPGQTTITVTCGDISQTCTVVCWFQEEETLPPETTAPSATEPKETEPKATEPKPTEPKATEPKATEPKPTEKAVLTLDPADASCFEVNEVFTIYARLGTTTADRSEVTWTSSDPKVAKVDNGIVTAVSKGEVTITAEYEGQKATCTVRCRFDDSAATDSQENQAGQQTASWKVSHTDVTITQGESFRLSVKNSDGETADAIWTMSMDGIISIDGQTITGQAPGTVTLKTEVEGTAFTCIVRVK